MVNIELDDTQALVLFEFLARFEKSAVLAVEHPSEERVLEQVQAALERNLVEPFGADYYALLTSARAAVCARWGT